MKHFPIVLLLLIASLPHGARAVDCHYTPYVSIRTWQCDPVYCYDVSRNRATKSGTCLSGNCHSGEGIASYYDGLIKASFKDSTPVGEGLQKTYDGVFRGTFVHGCLSGAVEGTLPGTPYFWRGHWDPLNGPTEGTWYTSSGRDVEEAYRGKWVDKPTTSVYASMAVDADKRLKARLEKRTKDAAAAAAFVKAFGPKAAAPVAAVAAVPHAGHDPLHCNSLPLDFVSEHFRTGASMEPGDPQISAAVKATLPCLRAAYDNPATEKSAAAQLEMAYKREWGVAKDDALASALFSFVNSDGPKPKLPPQ